MSACFEVMALFQVLTQHPDQGNACGLRVRVAKVPLLCQEVAAHNLVGCDLVNVGEGGHCSPILHHRPTQAVWRKQPTYICLRLALEPH